MMTEAEIKAGIQSAIEAEMKGTTVTTPIVEEVKPIIEEVKPIVEEVKPLVEEVKPIVEEVKPIVEEVKPIIEDVKPIIQKSIDEQVAEQSGGKYKTWAEVEEAMKPKEVFADEKIKHLNELALKGIDVTSREFIELQSLDVESLDKVDDILYEKWKRSEDGEGLSEKTIRAEINKKYNVNEWIEKADEDLTDDDIANQEKMRRDAGKGKEWLTNYKNERTLEKQEDPKVLQAMAEDAERAQKNWETFVETDLVNKITKLTTPILGKDGKTVEAEFNFDVSDADRKKYGDIMKRMPIDTNAFFGQFFKEVNGKQVRDDGAFLTMMLKANSYDKAVALARSEGASQEALRIEKEQKNTNFAPSQNGTGEPQVKTDAQLLAEAVGKMKI